jgi:excinuclease ABC subunit C
LKKRKIKEKIEVLENYQSRSTIVNPKSPISMFSIVSDESAAYVNLHFTSIRSHTMEIKKKLETDAELLELAIIELRAFSIVISRSYCPVPVDLGEHLKVTVQLGDKKQILDLSVRNAKFYRSNN